jgi:hypothetical protein
MKNLIFFSAVVTFLLSFSCNQEYKNPIGDDYTGDYRFSLSPNWTADTASAFTQYSIKITNEGKDLFDSFKITAASDSVIAVSTGAASGKDTSIAVVFTKPYIGKLTVTGIRPNKKYVNEELNLAVINPFQISGPSKSGPEGGQYNIVRASGVSANDGELSVTWMIDDSIVSSGKKTAEPLQFTAPADTYSIHAVISGYGASISTSPVNVSISETPLVNAPGFSAGRISFQTSAGQSIVISAPSVAKGKAKKYRWDFNCDNTSDSSTDSSFIVRTFETAGDDTIFVWFTDTSGLKSGSCTLFVKISPAGSPVVNGASLVNYTIASGDYAKLKLSAVSSGDKISRIVIDTSGTTIKELTGLSHDSVDTTVSILFTKTGTYNIGVTAYSTGGKGSIRYVTGNALVVKEDVPVIDSVKTSPVPDSVFINDTVTCTVYCSDINGQVKKLYISYGDSSKATDSAAVSGSDVSNSFKNVFKTAGDVTVYAWAVNGRDILSSKSKALLTVAQGKPVLKMSSSKDTVYESDSVKISLEASDNGSIAGYYMNTGAGFVSCEKTTGITYAKAGSYTIKAYVKDDDGLFSDTVKNTITVIRAVPVIDSIVLNGSSLFAGDTLRIRIKARDPRVTIKEASVVMKCGANVKTVSAQMTNGTVDTILKQALGVNDEGAWTLKATVANDRGYVSDTVTKTLVVKKGSPVIDSISPKAVWVNDDTTFKVSARDTTNGRVDSIYVSFDGGANYTVAGNDIKHRLPVEKGDSDVSVKVKVKNSRGVWSEESFNVRVKLGAPVVWGDSGDTLWVVVDKGYSGANANYYAKVNALDTNGTVQKYYWSNNEWPDSGTVTSVDSLLYSVTELNLNKAQKQYIYARDDDGLISGGRFVVFADSAPPIPDVFASVQGDSITIYWKGKDVKDGDQTRYMVLLHQGAEPDSSVGGDVLSGFKSGYAKDDESGYDFMYRFKIPTSSPKKLYKYQVWARDSRGSVTKDPGNHTFSY